MDISGMTPGGGHAQLAAQAPMRAPPEVAVVDESRSSDDARTDTNTAKRNDAAEVARDQRDARRDPDVHKGPPPTFEVTPLEAESDLHAALARMETSRHHDRDVEMVSPHDSTQSAKKAAESAETRSQAPPPQDVKAQEPAERVGVAQLDQPYDAPAAVAAE